MKAIRTTIVLLAGCLVTAALANDVPRAGVLYNTIENSAMTFNCKAMSGGTIECEFIQTSVRLKLKPEEKIARLQKSLRDYANKPEAPSQQECSGIIKARDTLVKGAVAADNAGFDKMTDRQRKRLSSIFEAFVAFCNKPNSETYAATVRASLEMEAGTCLVSSNSFKQTLTRAPNNTWAVVPERSGECGTVRLDRFEPEISSNLTFWNYVVRKAVTNPGATFGLGSSCSELDQAEYKYSWKRRNVNVDCDQLEFSAF